MRTYRSHTRSRQERAERKIAKRDAAKLRRRQIANDIREALELAFAEVLG